MEDIKVGQVWEFNKTIWIITSINEDWVCLITNKGLAATEKKELITGNLLATYPTWQEAVNSKEFKGE